MTDSMCDYYEESGVFKKVVREDGFISWHDWEGRSLWHNYYDGECPNGGCCYCLDIKGRVIGYERGYAIWKEETE